MNTVPMAAATYTERKWYGAQRYTAEPTKLAHFFFVTVKSSKYILIAELSIPKIKSILREVKIETPANVIGSARSQGKW